MAIHDLGHEAISLTGSQAGIVTDTTHGKAKIVDVRAHRIHEALDAGPHRPRRGLPGRVDRPRRDDARPRRLRHDRGRARRRARRRALRDLHGRRRASSPPTRASSRTRASSTRVSLRGDARDGGLRRGRAGQPARSSSRATTMCVLHVRSSFGEDAGTWIREEDETMLEKAMISAVVHQRRGDGLPGLGRRPLRASSPRSREASVNVDTIVQTSDEIVFSAPVEDRRDAARDARRARRRRGALATTSAR